MLLEQVLRYGADGGTDYTSALQATQRCIETHWSAERYVLYGECVSVTQLIKNRSPVVVFLSDGECGVSDSTVRDLCRRATALG